jgi:uncharacterized protein (DUF1778 family)
MPIKRRKARNQRKDEQIRVAVTPEQKKRLIEAAALTGQGVATWLRAIGLQEAAKVLGRST